MDDSPRNCCDTSVDIDAMNADFSKSDDAEYMQTTIRASDIKVNSYVAVSVSNRELLMYNINGRYRASDAKCSHMKLSLEGGRIMGNCIACPHHGAHFNLDTGDAESPPAIKSIKVYEVQVHDNMLWVSI